MVEQRPDRRRLAGAVGAEEAERLAFGDLEVDVDDPAVRAVRLGELLYLDDRGHDDPFPPAGTGTASRASTTATVPAASWAASAVGEEPIDHPGQLLLDERDHVAELLEPGLRAGRIAGGGDAVLRDLAEAAVDDPGVREHRVHRLRRRAEVLAPVAAPRRPADEAGRRQDPGGAADRAATRTERVRDLGGRLLRRVAEEQPAPHPARHRGHAVAAEELAHLFDERALLGRQGGSHARHATSF